jgi:aminoglycoside 3-N-acetyltransferase
MTSFTDLRMALLKLGLSHTPVIAHASLSAFGDVVGGAETLLRATLDSVWALVMPTFTYQTMIVPADGPPHNGMLYRGDSEVDAHIEPFTPEMPADRLMGGVSEALRLHSRARRSSHPILSFAGVNAAAFLAAQSMTEPLGVIAALAQADGWILLLGTGHTVNTSIHYAERLAGRRQFVRWALLQDRICECPGFPGDSAGFGVLAQDLATVTRQVTVGSALIQAMPVRAVLSAVKARLEADPFALLCDVAGCLRCDAIRESVRLTTPA